MPIEITARRDGFRRLGIAHSATTTTYPDDHFSPDELKSLLAEPQLIVVRVSGEATGAQPDEASQKVISDLKAKLATAEKTISGQQLLMDEKDAALLQLDQDVKQQQQRITELEAELQAVKPPAGDAAGESTPGTDAKTSKGK
ncbi:hypothetical protein JNO12_14890 [Erwinia aphidicola]|nr:hypothetical protein [Erwinia aphidicola]